MTLTIGLLTLILATLGASLAMRIVGNAHLPDWLRDGFISNVYLPLLTGILALGIGYVAYGIYQLVYGYVPLLTLDTLSGGLLAAVLVLGLCWPLARRVVFGPPELSSSVQPKAKLTVVQTSVIDEHDTFRSAA